jgi:hypothetical protein
MAAVAAVAVAFVLTGGVAQAKASSPGGGNSGHGSSPVGSAPNPDDLGSTGNILGGIYGDIAPHSPGA